MNLIRLGDTTDHGGEVITASETMRYCGRRVARKGDRVNCPQHAEVQSNVILKVTARSPTTAFRSPGKVTRLRAVAT